MRNKIVRSTCFLAFLIPALLICAGCAQNNSQPSNAAATGGVTMIPPSSRSSPSDSIPRISIQDLKKKMDGKADYILIDNRSIDEFKTDHIKGAVNITLAAFLDGDYIIPAGSLQTREIILY